MVLTLPGWLFANRQSGMRLLVAGLLIDLKVEVIT